MQMNTESIERERLSLDEILQQLQDLKFALEQSSIIAVTNREGIITFANDKFCEISKYSKDELIGTSHSILNSGYHSKDFFRKLWSDIRNGLVWKGEIRNKAKDGQYYWVDTTIVPFLDSDGKPYQYISIRNEITARKQIEEELKTSKQRYKRLALTDVLTDLPNRVSFLEKVQKAISKGEQFSVICLDLDRFKIINDTLGYRNGDLLLCKIAKRLQSMLEKEAILSRFGGDEFFILLQETGMMDVKVLSQQVLQSFQIPFFLQGQEVYISSSLGICKYPGDGEDVESLMKNVDMAMYRAKGKGGHTYHFFNDELREEMKRKTELEWGLRKAIQNNQLQVYFQPIVDLGRERIVGAEALLRWDTPEHGFVSPAEFIPIAEESGLIVSLGEWVLREACRLSLSMQAEYESLRNTKLAVNVSIQQLLQSDFVQKVKEILRQTAFPARQLVLEITESTAMQHISHIAAKLQALRDEGIRIALDDFGTGYSSLNYLKQLPIDILKIDRAFMKDITQSPADLTIVKAVIDIAHSLHLAVVAEGVELLEQKNCLKMIDCDRVQGYFYSPPVPACNLAQLLQD